MKAILGHLVGSLLLVSCAASPTPVAEPAPRAPAPVEPEPAPRWVELDAGALYTCARRSDGLVACWGNNQSYQLGRLTEDRRTVPPIALELNATDISAGQAHGCAVDGEGAVRCWGTNGSGELGDGGYDARPAPGLVPGLADVVQVSAGGFFTCARRVDGSVACWGSNAQGQLGDGTRGRRRLPVSVPDLVALEVSAGGSHTCARIDGGGVKCWGSNQDERLGSGTSERASMVPVDVPGLTDVVAISVGAQHTCALREGGAVVCWGYAGVGRLGDPERTGSSAAPVPVAGLDDAVAIDAGARHTCAVRRSGAVACWGEGSRGRLGDGEEHPDLRGQAPVPVAGLDDARAVTVGDRHACALRADGSIVCWGENRLGQLGAGAVEVRPTPGPVEGLAEAEHTAAQLGRPYEAPARVVVPRTLDAVFAEGLCPPPRTDDDDYRYDDCLRALEQSEQPRARFLFGRLDAERCMNRPACVARALRQALLFEEDDASSAMLAEATRLESFCRDGGELPEGARREEVQGAGELVFFGMEENTYGVSNGSRTCFLDPMLGYPRRAQSDGGRVRIDLTDNAAGHDEGCTNYDYTYTAVVLDFAAGELLRLPMGRDMYSECPDEPRSRRRRVRPQPARLVLRGDTFTVERERRSLNLPAPTRWLVGRTATLREGVYRISPAE